MVEPNGPLQSAPLGYAAMAAAVISVCFLVSSPMVAIVWGSGALLLLGAAVFFRYHSEGLRRKKLPKSPRSSPQPGPGPPNGSSTQLIGARYRRVSVLGEGGMKRVYLAEDTKLRNRQCAIAELLDVATDPAQQQVNQRSF